MGSCAHNRRLSLSLVLGSAACLGGATALWRPNTPAASTLDQHIMVLDAAPPAELMRDDEAPTVWPTRWNDLGSSTSEMAAPSPVHVYFMYAEPTVSLRRVWLRSLFGWMFALVAMGLVAAALGRIRAARRPLPLAVRR